MSSSRRLHGGEPDSDRNLLFAVLALQADLIDQERFVQACTLWASRKDRPLATLLVEQGWLSAEDRADVERLLARKLKKHNGDAHASLVEAAGIQARTALACIADPDVERSLVGLATTPPASEDGAAGPPGERAGRNLLFEELGHGGMGVVLRGHDPELGRDLAVKLLPRHQSDARLERRFVEEAQITGQLQHPGVVPIYELGRFIDQRPYFTMKLIKGQTLAEMLAARPEVAHELPRYLGIFEQVCQALAYAHSHGVIHRDLKPANIMVGAFGEVQVMDWGLARVLSSSQLADPEQTTAASLIRIARSGSTAEGEGRTGVVGTPAYMSPEQARGNIDQVDERADVFGLGGILCVILTGKPPYAGGNMDEVMRKGMAADLGEVLSRLECCGAETELVALARACLASRREDRPRNAAVVAERLSAYLAGVQERLRLAGLERAAAEARAEEEARTRRVAEAKAALERRARRLTAGLAALLLVLFVGGGSAAWLWQQQRHEAGAAAKEAMSEARLRLADGRFAEALAAARKAQELARTGGAAGSVREEANELAEQIEREDAAVRRDRRLLAALLEVRGPREGPRFEKDRQGLLVPLAQPSADQQFAAAFREWDPTFDVDTLSTTESAVRLRDRPAAVRAEVIAALDEWTSERRMRRMSEAKWRRVADLAAALDDEQGARRGELRQLLAGGTLERERALGMLALAMRPVPLPFDAGLGRDRQRLRRLVEKTDVAKEPVLGLLTMSRALVASGDDVLADRLLAAAVQARPHEVVLYHALGQLRERQNGWSQAVECHAAARALRPEQGVALARALVISGRVGEGLALFERLVAERSDNPWLRHEQATALHHLGRDRDAEAAYRTAIRLQPNLPEFHIGLGVALYSQGRMKEAELAFRQAIQFRHDYAIGHLNLGTALHNLGRFKEAETAFRQAIDLQPDFHRAHGNLGTVLTSQNRFKEAEAAFRTAIRLRHDEPVAHSNLGGALNKQHRYREAEGAFRQAIRLQPDFLAAHYGLCTSLDHQRRFKEADAVIRQALRLQSDSPEAHFTLGNLRGSEGRYREAEAAYRAAIRLQPDYPLAYCNLGLALFSQRRVKEAVAALHRAVRLKPDFHEGYVTLGGILGRVGRFKEAEAAYHQALRLQHDLPEAHFGLGMVLRGEDRLKESEAAFRQVIRLRPNDPLAHYNLANLLSHQDQPREAEASYRESIRLKPDNAQAHCNLGHALRKQGRFTEALASLRRGHALGSASPGWPYPSNAWVRECQRLIELDQLLPAVLNGDAEPASAKELLELASLCQMPCKRLHATAVRFAAAAFASEAKAADDLQQGHRYNAACSAALAAAGQAEDARLLPDKVTLKLRQQAYLWLQADLTLYARLAERNDPRIKQAVRERLLHWQQDRDLVWLRDQAALNRLDAGEQQQWQRLWQEVDALLARVAPRK
jgi:serine/threonine-protein kinase